MSHHLFYSFFLRKDIVKGQGELDLTQGIRVVILLTSKLFSSRYKSVSIHTEVLNRGSYQELANICLLYLIIYLIASNLLVLVAIFMLVTHKHPFPAHTSSLNSKLT